MYLKIVYSILFSSFIVWFILQSVERRRVVNGLAFLISIGSLYMLLLHIGIQFDLKPILFITGLIGLIFLIAIPLLYITVTITMVTSGVKLMKREGVTLSHGLSFMMGLGILVSSLVFPFIQRKTSSNWILIPTEFFLTSFAYFVIGFIIFSVAALAYTFAFERKNKNFLIVLGCGLNKDKVTPILAARVDKAIEFYNKQKEKGQEPIIIMSGGQGKDELIPESHAMRNYAIEKGIDSGHILVEDKSTTTRENLLYSNMIIESFKLENPKVLFFTNNYHVFRSAILARSLGLNFQGRGAKTKLYFSISAFIREYIGVLFINKKANILFCGIIVVLRILYGEYLRVLGY